MDDLLHHAQQLASQASTPIAQPIEGRVAYVVNQGHRASSGNTQQLAEALNQHGFETLCMVRPGWPWDEIEGDDQIAPESNINGVRYLHSTLPSSALGNLRTTLEATVEKLIRLLRIYRPAVVLAETAGVGLPAWIAAKRLGLAFYALENEKNTSQSNDENLVKKEAEKVIHIQSKKQLSVNEVRNYIYQLFPNLNPRVTLDAEFVGFYEGTNVKRTSWFEANVLGKEKVELCVASDVEIPERKIIAKIIFLDDQNREIEPQLGSLHYSEVYKWFKYLPVYKGDLESANKPIDIVIPEKAINVKISLVNIGNFEISGVKASVLLKDKSLIKSEADLERCVFDFIVNSDDCIAVKSKAIVYGDVSPNVLDGSSIWLTSVVNIVSASRKTVLLLKDNIKTEKVVSNIKKSNNLLIIEPKDIGFTAPLDQQSAASALSMIYSHCPQVTALITRGVDLGYEIQKRKEFTGVFYPYLTDFYEVTEQGFTLVDAKVSKLKEIVLNARSVLFQTEEIHKKIEEIVGYKVDGVRLPPTIPENISEFSKSKKENDGFIHIGYAGKVQPRWGVAELIGEVGKQVAKGKNIKLHIATGKIYGKGKEGSKFVKEINELLKNDFVEIHEDLPREEALSLLSTMDLVWCYRDPHLENSTLELSTKLVETAALGKPCVVYSSKINQNFLGRDYPFLIENPSKISNIIENLEELKAKVKDELKVLSKKVIENYTFSSLRNIISKKIDEDNASSLKGKKIVISGHDLKFVYSYLTHLRRQGAEVGIDPWEWGEQKSASISEHYAEWADYIFCEWGLANAVWHSKNKKNGKKLFVRIHAQEVRKKAEKFGHAIASSKVDKFIFVSPLIREQALELFSWPESKTVVIPNGVKENRFFNPNGETKPILGMVGIVPTTKRLDRALDLLAALNERGWEAKLYCKGHRPEDLPFMRAPGRKQELEYYENLYERIKKNSYLKDYVFFDGWGNDVEQWYRKVDFILSPSDNESFHYALADGVMAGCIPIVWPWEGVELTYPKEWVVNNVATAADYVEKMLTVDNQEAVSVKIENLNFIASKYLEKSVFYKTDLLW